MSSDPRANERFGEIDVLRGICALAVVLYHFTARFEALVGFDGAPDPGVYTRLPFTVIWGFLPVYAFFTISGFVITMTIERSRTGSDFIVSRFSRIFPVYWVAVGLTYSLWQLRPAFDWHVTVPQMLVNLTMLQDFAYVPHVDGVYWSLGVELAFYAGIWLLFIAGGWNHLRLVCAFWLAGSVAYALLGDGLHIPYRVASALDLKYAPYFVTGIALYRLNQARMKRRDRPWRDWLLLGAAAVSFFAVQKSGEGIYMLGVLAIWLLCISGRVNFIARKPLVYFGTISYALYLTHQMIGYQVLQAVPGSPAFRIAVATAVAIALASALTFLVERPAQRAIRRRYRAWMARRQSGQPESLVSGNAAP